MLNFNPCICDKYPNLIIAGPYRDPWLLFVKQILRAYVECWGPVIYHSHHPGRYNIHLVYSYFMPVCSIVQTITPRCCGRPDALLHEAEGLVQ